MNSPPDKGTSVMMEAPETNQGAENSKIIFTILILAIEMAGKDEEL